MIFTTMELEAIQINPTVNEKIQKALEKFLDPNFKVKNDVYLNLFLTRLVCKDETSKTSLIETNKELREQFNQWIIKASNLWGNGKVHPPAPILAFALNLTSHISCDEHIFVDLNCKNVFESLVGIAQRNSAKDPKVIHGMVTLLCSFLEHKSGLQWLMATTHWAVVINLGWTANPENIRKKAYQFVTNLLEKTIAFNRRFGVTVVGRLLKPLKDVFRSLSNLKNGQQDQSAEIFETLKFALEFISEVISTLLKSSTSSVLRLFIEQQTEETVDKMIYLSETEDLSYKLLKVKCVFLFYKLCLRLKGVKVVAHDSLDLCDITTMFELIRDEMRKNHVKGVIKICDYAHGLYCNLSPRLPLSIRKGETIEFQYQMVLFQLMPLLVFSIQIYCGKLKHPDELFINDDFRRDFFKTLSKKAAVKSIELCYKWSKNLETKKDLMEDVTFSLEYVTKTKGLLNKERAATVFPPLVYALKDTLTVIKTLVNIDWTPRCIQFLTTLVDTIVDFVESFDLTWKDTIETIRVMDLACDFLNYSEWNDQIIVIKGLKLLNTAISKYMCPDMVLLIYSTKDSPVSQAGSLLYDKCHDTSWEIRDSALEVVHTLALNANIRFPALSSVILDAELPRLVVKMALKDDEYYVRATAFRCLQEFIQIPDIWDVLFDVPKFWDSMLYVFERETEGIVLKEVTILVYKIYKYQNFPDEILPRLYDVMTHAATGDLYWEVKYNALDFWFNSWSVYLTEEGMIDCMFPTHTFSKTLKKIVALNDTEVRKRIIKVMNQLADIGCLHVLKCTIQDDRDIEVSKKVTRVTLRLIEMFRKYKVSCENVDLIEPPGFTSRSYHQLFEPVSPASSTTMTAMSPGDIGNPGSPQYTNSPYVDPLSPFPAPFSPFSNLELTPSDSIRTQYSSSRDTQHLSNDTQYATPIYQQEVPIETTPNLDPEQDLLFYKTPASQDPLSINPTDNMFDEDMLGSWDGDCTDAKDVTVNNVSIVKREKFMDEFLNPNVTLLQNIYNPTDQLQISNNTHMKTRTYLAPSQYLKFVYDEIEHRTTTKSSLDQFNSLVDDIVKEYNIVGDVNGMECH